MIVVTNDLRIYEVDGEPVSGLNSPIMEVTSHYADDAKVVLIVGGVKYTLLANDLQVAIENATNVK